MVSGAKPLAIATQRWPTAAFGSIAKPVELVLVASELSRQNIAAFFIGTPLALAS
jgi:hypothetical protein